MYTTMRESGGEGGKDNLKMRERHRHTDREIVLLIIICFQQVTHLLTHHILSANLACKRMCMQWSVKTSVCRRE